jgi:hypothetical protein
LKWLYYHDTSVCLAGFLFFKQPFAELWLVDFAHVSILNDRQT